MEGRIAFWICCTEGLDRVDVVGWVAGHSADLDCDAISHAEYTQLGDRVLLEVFSNESDGVVDGQEMSRGSKILFHHSGRQIKN